MRQHVAALALLVLVALLPIDFSRVQHGVTCTVFVREDLDIAPRSGADVERLLFGPPSFEGG